MKGRKVKERNLLTFLSHWVKPILRHTLLLNLTPDVNNAFLFHLIHLRWLLLLLLTQSQK